MLDYRLTLAWLSKQRLWLIFKGQEIGTLIIDVWLSLKQRLRQRRLNRSTEEAGDVYAHATRGQSLVIAIYEGQLRYERERNERLVEEVRRLTNILTTPVQVVTEEPKKNLEPLPTTSRSLSSRAARIEADLRKKQKDASDVLRSGARDVGVAGKE